MDSKERLIELVQTIKKLTGQTQEEISVAAGYKPRSLTQLLSSKTGHDAVSRRLEVAYRDILRNSIKGAQLLSPSPIANNHNEYKEKYIKMLEKQLDIVTKNVDVSLGAIHAAIATTQVLLESLYQKQTGASPGDDKTLVERIKRIQNKDKQI